MGKTFFDLFRFELNDLNHRTALLEAHDWDEEATEETLRIVMDFIQCSFLMPPPGVFVDFDDWVTKQVDKELLGLGLSEEQSKIVCQLIINKKEEFLTMVNLEEN